MSWVDGLIGAYFLYCVTAGLRRGFAACFFGMAAGIGSVVGAFILCKPASALVNSLTGASDALSSHIQRSLSASVPAAAKFDGLMQIMQLSRIIGVEVDIAEGMTQAAGFVAQWAVAAGCFFALLILLRLALIGLGRIIAIPLEHGPIRPLNSLAGGVFGGLLAFVNVAVAWLVLVMLVAVGAISPSFLQQSLLLGFIGDCVARVVPWVIGLPLAGGI